MNALYTIAQLLGLVAFIALLWLAVRAFKRHVLWGLAVLFLSPVSAVIYGIKYWRQDRKPFLVYIMSFLTALTLAIYVFSAWGGWKVVQSAARVQGGIHDQSLTQADALKFMRSGIDFIGNSNATDVEREQLAMMSDMLNRFESGMSEEDVQQLQHDIVNKLEQSGLSQEERHTLKQIHQQLTVTTATEAEVKTEPPVKARSRMAYVPVKLSEAGNYLGFGARVTRGDGVERSGHLAAVTGNLLRFEQRKRSGSLSFQYRKKDIKSLKILKEELY